MGNRFKLGFGALALAFICAGPASADMCAAGDPAGDVCFDLNRASGMGNPGTLTPPNYYVQVAIQQLVLGPGGVGDEVKVTVTLNPTIIAANSNSDFVTTGNGNNHPTFGFNLNIPITSSNVTDPTANSQFETGPFNTSDGFGSFQYAIIDTKGSGQANGIPSPIVFDITATGITAASFVGDNPGHPSSNYLFVSDIFNGSATFLTAKLPEPATMFFFGAGLLGLFALLRRRVFRYR